MDFGERPVILDFYESVLRRDRQAVLQRAPAALEAASHTGEFYPTVIGIMCENDFLKSLGYVAPEPEYGEEAARAGEMGRMKN